MNLRKLISLFVLITLAGGSALAVEGCFDESYTPVPAYGYNAYSAPYYPYSPGYVSGPPVVYGDWDEHHEWHHRDWWMEHRRPWVEQHHHEWIARPAPHEFWEHHERHVHD